MAKKEISRREFLKTGALSVGGAAASVGLTAGHKTQDAPGGIGPEAAPVELHVNGKTHRVTIEPRVTLLRALRNHLDITGPKEPCDRGACGGCTVLVEGKPVVSCMMLALDARGKEITTAEGLVKKDGRLDEVQEAFGRLDAFQCGYCTPGMVVSAKALIDRHPEPTPEQIREGLCGNICRCAAYPNIFKAVEHAAQWKREGY